MKKLIYSLLLAAGFFSIAACTQKEPVCQPPSKECNTYGTVVNVTCGIGVYNNLWILTDDGNYLQPCQTDFPNMALKEGQRVHLGYEKISSSKACSDDIIRCMAAVPKADKIHIICLKIEEPACTPLTTVEGQLEKSNVNILDAKLNGDCLELKVGFSGCNNDAENIQLQWDGQRHPNYPTTVYLSAIHTKPTMCNAYFTTTVSYDVSTLKNSSSNYLHIYVSGWKDKIEY